MSQYIDTREEAKASVARHLPYMRGKVFDAICEAGKYGLTYTEAAEQLDILPQTVVGRINELCNDQLIEDSGKRRETRRGGRQARVYVKAGTVCQSEVA